MSSTSPDQQHSIPFHETLRPASEPKSQDRQTDLEQQEAGPLFSESQSASAETMPLVVGLGASAGGLKPLQQFFDHLPKDFGASFVVVQHLSPDFKSLMSELLGRHTHMTVKQAEDGQTLEPNSVYLIPPKKNLTLNGVHLRLADQDLSTGHRLNFPIDVFFESLANQLADKSIGIILSGTGSDGTRGLRAINEAGGLALVQDPQSSEFDGMPRSAISAGLAHYILPPDQLAQTIGAFLSDPQHFRNDMMQAEVLEDGEPLQKILSMIRIEDGIDFSHYKPATLARRTSRRMLIAGYRNFDEYLEHIEESRQERQALLRDLLISVTSFFRDPQAWQIMENKILPETFSHLSHDEPIRAWVTACATGEEVYTLAILLHEYITRHQLNHEIKIFATDLDKHALDVAAQGIYPESIAADVSPELLHNYFLHRAGRYHISRMLREMVIFAPHNLTRDAPFTKMDLITCRNVLIYLQPHLQKRVLSSLHYGLKHHGTLFLGAAESIGDLESEFERIDQKWKIFRKRRDIVLPIHPHHNLPARVEPVAMPRGPKPLVRQSQQDLIITETIRTLLRTRRGASLIVGTDNELMHVFGEASPYLGVPEGEGTMDVTRMVNSELALPLKAAMHRARKDKEAVEYRAMRVTLGQEVRDINIHVSFHVGEKLTPDFTLIVFEDSSGDDPQNDSTVTISSDAKDRISDLERELQQTRESLQVTIEELETTNEEQQATNEELLASNEQLQSTNEELHSVNEELYTVNAEYQSKIQELTQLNLDMDNLLESTQIGTIFLDGEKRIRKFTPAISQVFSLAEVDIGRPIANFAHKLIGSENMDELCNQVLSDKVSIERHVRTSGNASLLMRANPYLKENKTVDGVVLTFVDITELAETQEKLQTAQRSLQQRTTELEKAHREASKLAAIVESTSEAVISKTPQGIITTWNHGAELLYGYAAEQVLGRSVEILIPEHLRDEHRKLIDELIEGRSIDTIDTQRIRADGQVIEIMLTMSPIRDITGQLVGLSSISRDISERKEAERLQHANIDLKQRNVDMEHFVYSVSHDLKSPLVTISGMVGMAKNCLSKNQIDRAMKGMATAEETAEKMRRMIDDLLELGRIGRHAIQIQQVDLHKMLDEIVQDYRKQIAKTGCEILRNVKLRLIDADPARLRHVLDNLISNALKYACSGDGPRIDLGAYSEDDRYILYVKDNGPGIDPDYHDRIFQLFERVDRDREGSGVGLTIVKHIVEVHGGKVWIESKPGHGACFFFSLPMQPAQDVEAESAD